MLERRERLFVTLCEARDGLPLHKLRESHVARENLGEKALNGDLRWLKGQPGVIQERRGHHAWVRFSGVRP